MSRIEQALGRAREPVVVGVAGGAALHFYTGLRESKDQDRDDIRALARAGLLRSDRPRRRAEEALSGYLGNVARSRGSINSACHAIDAEIHAARR